MLISTIKHLNTLERRETAGIHSTLVDLFIYLFINIMIMSSSSSSKVKEFLKTDLKRLKQSTKFGFN